MPLENNRNEFCDDVFSCPVHAEAMRELERLRSQGEALLPVKVSPRYQKLLEKEFDILGDTGGPLYSVSYPKPERFNTFVSGEVQNFVMDSDYMPAGFQDVLVHRYPAKALFLATCSCLGHCQYCFRPDIAGVNSGHAAVSDNLSADILDKVCAYLYKNPQIQEIIFSGGDPLVCSIERLENAVSRLLSVPSVKYCRLHTRAPAFAPEKLSERCIRMLEEYDIRTVFHFVHPYEIDEEVSEILYKMRRRGIMMYNQFPMVRSINDHPAVILELAYRCAQVGVQMLSMFITDPIKYGAVYRPRLQRVFDTADEIFFHAEAWLSNIRVCQDTPIGKVKREHVSSCDIEKGQYTFSRQGRSVVYQDIPLSLDEPSSLKTLLYAGAEYVDPGLWADKYYGR